MSNPPTASITERDVKVDDASFHIAESGSKGQPAVVWLHGSGPGVNALSNWRGMLERFGSEFYSLAPDMLGFGDSTHPDPPPQGVRAFTELRVTTLLQLLDHLGLGTVTLVGNSMGAIVALALVERAPQRVDRIVLMGPGGAPGRLTDDLVRVIKFYDDPTAANMAVLMSRFVYDPTVFGEDLAEIAAARMPRASRPDIRQSHLATFARVGEPLVFDDAQLSRMSQPTLVAHGRHDRIIPVEASYYFAERMPNAGLHVFAKAGHWLQLEHPDRFANLVRGFIQDEL
jgi:2-hydroxymuconate-semialdehyde hydrolase